MIREGKIVLKRRKMKKEEAERKIRRRRRNKGWVRGGKATRA
jgi:hypothetical protein